MSLFFITLLGLVGLDKSATALHDYVAKPDPAYRYEKRAEQTTSSGMKITQLKMVSQKWHDIEWKHLIYIFEPAKITTPGHAMLFITGGGWNESLDNAPEKGKVDAPKEAMAIASQAGMPVVAITHVPFQPIFNGLVEDEIISHTFVQFLDTHDPTWPLLFPMVKAAIRAMDTAQKHLKETSNTKVNGFTVFGASKRGWTTWLTAASGDPRVKGIMPIVIDTLNMPAQMKHQLESYGEYSDQIKDYTEKGIQQRMDTPIGRELNAMVDPYNYRKKLTLPKLIINGTNDPYWTLDSLNLYWDSLVGPKYIFYAPNGTHSLSPESILRLASTAAAFAKMAAGKLTFPKMTWELNENDDGLSLAVKADLLPASARAWIATSDTRDFRRSKWESTPMQTKDDAFVHDLLRPAAGYAAMFGEAKFLLDGKPVYLCTNVKIIPAKEVPKK